MSNKPLQSIKFPGLNNTYTVTDIENFASAYSTSSTYQVGEYVTYDGDFYRCITDISTAEAWTPAHWVQVTVGEELSDYKADINQLQNDKADIIISNASGAIASFTDGADGLPLESLDINVADGTPVIVTRTSKNLIDDSIKYKGSNTIVAIGNNYDFSIFLKAGTYTLSVELLNDTHYGAYYRELNDSENTIIWASTGIITSASFTLSEDGWYRIWLYRGSPVVDVNDIGRFQLELGSTATDYEPYQCNTYTFTTPYDASTGEITTLLGVNNVWSDTGDTDVTYRADTKLYLESHMPEIPVEDVQVNGASVVNQGVANVPVASSTTLGVGKVSAAYGTNIIASDGIYKIEQASSSNIKSGTQGYKPIVPERQHESAFYGLAKAAGDSSQSASSNAVGVYTDSAKVAIQKMLGIYEAPWELIREDTVTNETEADIDITVDGNGNAFELTDMRLMVCLPTQDSEASIGNYGRVRCYYDSTNNDVLYIGAYTQAAGGTSRPAVVSIEQHGGMIERLYSTNAPSGNNVPIQFNNQVAPGTTSRWQLENKTYKRILIGSVKGTCKYYLYGKRKWS